MRALDKIGCVEDIQAVSKKKRKIGGDKFRPYIGFAVRLADQHADLDGLQPPEVMVLDQVCARQDVKLEDVENEGEKPEELVEEPEVDLAADDEALGVDNEEVARPGA
jgi:hypothetical protein